MRGRFKCFEAVAFFLTEIFAFFGEKYEKSAFNTFLLIFTGLISDFSTYWFVLVWNDLFLLVSL